MGSPHAYHLTSPQGHVRACTRPFSIPFFLPLLRRTSGAGRKESSLGCVQPLSGCIPIHRIPAVSRLPSPLPPSVFRSRGGKPDNHSLTWASLSPNARNRYRWSTRDGYRLEGDSTRRLHAYADIANTAGLQIGGGKLIKIK